MHRSGTSLVTNLLGKMGIGLPKEELSPNRANSEGYAEPSALVALHDNMLEEAKSSWSDWRPFQFRSLPVDRQVFYITQISIIIAQQFPNYSVFALKDPRICRFAGLFCDILKSNGIETFVVIVFRNPMAVCASLQSRDHIDFHTAELLWLRHTLDAVAETAHMKRVFIDYDEVLKDWRKALKPLADIDQLLSSNMQALNAQSIEQTIKPSLNHWKSEGGELPSNRHLSAWTQIAYSDLCSANLSKGILPHLSKARAEFQSAADIFAKSLHEESRRADLIPYLEEQNRCQKLELDSLKSSLDAWKSACRHYCEELSIRKKQLLERDVLFNLIHIELNNREAELRQAVQSISALEQRLTSKISSRLATPMRLR